MVRLLVVPPPGDPVRHLRLVPPATSDEARAPTDRAQIAGSLVDGRSVMRVLGTEVDLFDSGDDVLACLEEPSVGARHLCYVNAHSLNLAYENRRFYDVLERADFVLNDGMGLRMAARMQGKHFPENLNGSDFTIRVLRLAAERNWAVYLYGGYPGVAETARDRLVGEISGLNVVGVRDGYNDDAAEDVIADIRRSGADLLIVALGQPRQELWLDENLALTGCHLGLGVGAFLDFVSGRVTRAPRWMNRLGVEWVFRLAQEPRRLWSRYLVGNWVFLWRAQRCGDAERQPAGPPKVVARRSS